MLSTRLRLPTVLLCQGWWEATSVGCAEYAVEKLVEKDVDGPQCLNFEFYRPDIG